MAKKNIAKEEEKEKQQEAQQPVNKNDSLEEKDSDMDNRAAGESKEEPSDLEMADVENEDKDDKDESAPEEEDSLEVKLAEMQDRYIRLSAEFDNYRKRTLKERMELTKTAGESILLSLLPVMDDFDRAMNLMESASDCKAMKEGIDLIYSKMKEFLKQNGVKEIEAMDNKFDTDLHEAVTKIPATDKKKKGKVVDVVQKGYYLNDKIIRHSKVVVGE